MRVRQILILGFVAAAVLPSMFFGGWAYREAMRHDFADVEDRHLLLARNIASALERYHSDLESTVGTVFDAISSSPENAADFGRILKHLNIECIALRNAATGTALHETPASLRCTEMPRTPAFGKFVARSAPGSFAYSPVMAGPRGNNVIYGVLKRDDVAVIARIATDYFVQLGKSVSFGVKGHSAIVDHQGNVLAHPNADWIAERRNIAEVSAISRLMRGESGIERFYSPALDEDMIAGLASVSGPGWGVMIPQPASERYAMVLENLKMIFGAIALRLLVATVFVLILLKWLVKPIERLVRDIHRNSRTGAVEHIEPLHYSVGDVKDIASAYNRMIDRIRDSNSEIIKLANTDLITELPNRTRFSKLISDELLYSVANGTRRALALLDIDNFKDINDLHGHQKGDEVLLAIAGKLVNDAGALAEKLFARPPMVCRLGGDEFAIIIPDVSDHADVGRYLDKALAAISEIGPELNLESECSASIGYCLYPVNGSGMKELMRHADIAMYEAKRLGKNCAQVYDPDGGSLTENEIRADFAHALSDCQLVLEYQPTICTRRQAVAGSEALVRWQHPRLGRLPPGVWLPAITGSSLINELGNWVFETAMKTQLEWKRRGYDLTIAINVSSEQFASSKFAEEMIAITRRIGGDPKAVFLEVTEDALFANAERAENVLRQLKEFGFRIAIDDFGTGYSNLARLANLPIDFIKIDKSLIVGAMVDSRVAAILATTIRMAKDLDCKIVAEGIETREIAEFATRNGADLLQGYFFSASLPSEKLIGWIDTAENGSLADYRGALEAA